MDPTAPQESQLPLPGRTRKTATAKALWKTVWMMLAKSLLYICITAFLIYMVKMLIISCLAEFSDIEGRIAKMVQVQIEVVDNKVDCLVTDLNKKINERSEVLEAALDDLKSKDLVKRKGNGDVEVRLDEMREIAKEIVEKEIDKHAADGLGMVDYALHSAGGMVVKHSKTSSDDEKDKKGIINFLFGKTPYTLLTMFNARTMLKPSLGEPGQCFALKGNNGFVDVQLRTAIVPEAIILEHVSKSVSRDRSSAPKHCRVSGWLQGQKSIETELTEFTYDLEKRNVQTFKVLEHVRSTVIDTVRFEFTSNHGNPHYTCIYRLRVHGHKPTS